MGRWDRDEMRCQQILSSTRFAISEAQKRRARAETPEGPPLFRASHFCAPPTHVPSPHELGACEVENPESIRRRRRSTASRMCAWTAPMAAPCRRRSSPALVLQWTAHVLQGALMRQADRHDQCRPRGGPPRARQPPAPPLLPRANHMQPSGTRLPRSAVRQ